MSDIKQYEPLWGSWYVDGEPLGEGSFGKVYKVYKEEFGRKYYAAVKIMSLPQSQADLDRVRSEYNDNELSVGSYFESMTNDIVKEIELMSIFRGNSNVVSLEDHEVVEKVEKSRWASVGWNWSSVGWDILIRMELLQTLSSYITEHPLTTQDVMQVGIDIAHALELCAVKNVIHRDIKPDNIFVSDYGDFKLGDFGVARHIEKMTSEMSKKGTPTYMAPEIYLNKPYGPTVDLYSLGLVMYRYLNNNRVPFMPPFPEAIQPNDRTKALERRMSGAEPIPDIPNISPELNDFVLKACAYDPDDRFQTAEEFRIALEKIAGVQSKAPVHEVEIETRNDTSKRKRPLRKEDDERTTGVISLRREETQAQSSEAKPEVPAKIMNVLSLTGTICAGILTLLSIFSGKRSDIFFSMPMYAMLAAVCLSTFKVSALNLTVIVWLICHLAFTALMNPAAFDYSLLAMTLGIVGVEVMRSPSPKYKRILSVGLTACALVLAVLVYRTSGASTSQNFQALVKSFYGIPLMLAMSAVMILLSKHGGGGIIAYFSALQLWPLVVFMIMIMSTLAGKFSHVLLNLMNASFVGFTPERFSWWTHARILGLLVQIIASECVVLTCAGKIIPADFLGMLANKRKALLIFGLTIILTAAGISVFALM